MYPRRRWLLAALVFWLAQAPVARAGMPSPLPTDPERIFRLNDTALGRLQTISFFLLGLLLSALAIQGLWNFVRRDFPHWPRLSFARALAAVLLWGLLFVVVLTMVAGARELMTPGAWQKQGFTYKLSPDLNPRPEADPTALRRQNLERLRTALWHFAATHGGRFPSQAEAVAFGPELWEVPGSGGLRYLYVPGLSAYQSTTLLAYEPELDPRQRFGLQTNGSLVALTSKAIDRLRNQGEQP